MTMSITKEIKKSIRQTITVLAGTISRGKYTFVNRFELATNELLDSVNEDAKNCQGKVAAHTSKIRGTPSGTFESNNQPMNHITAIVNKGRITLHNTPIAVCLYRTNISRQARK
jgi:hypothetical protein